MWSQSSLGRLARGVLTIFEVKKGLTTFSIRGIRQPISYDSSLPDRQGVSPAGRRLLSRVALMTVVSERDVADTLRLHYSTVSRLIRRGADSKTSKSKT